MRWPRISETYLAPLIEALRLMLPVGLAQRGRNVFARNARAALLRPAGQPAGAAGSHHRLRQANGRNQRGLKRATQRDDLEPLIALGLVTREVGSPRPRRAKTDRQVRLLVPPGELPREAPSLGRSSKQADALAQSPRPLPACRSESCVRLSVARPAPCVNSRSAGG